MDTGRQSAALDIAVVRGPGRPSTARWGRCSKFLLIRSAGEAFAVVVYVFAGRVWGFVVAGVLFALGCLFTCYYINLPAQEPQQLLPVAGEPRQESRREAAASARRTSRPSRHSSTYRREETSAAGSGAAAEECAVCINTSCRMGRGLRRLPACGHVYHARCINGWLRAHASCPMCRAEVKLAVKLACEPSAGAAV
ncbi:hypothetical protein BAE44_0008068 [Dichanthelium oligosanthes]|uniref:RING-type domain-containing protein n=1 Tax=Dichanthelium oligosanthes TaxID=888268 RepID=A0A1E5W0J6_9POAL|nr:hypothetical protein BAE44_0008068 [Dichanthelium oligosanthes]